MILKRFSSTLANATAKSAWKKSCYYKIDFKIKENSNVFEAVQKFSAYNIGCLAVTNKDEKVIGIISERDYISKIALLGRSSKDTKVSEICTFEPNLSTAKENDNIQECMNKMLLRNVRHLLILDQESKDVVGLLSIKDLVKEVMEDKDKIIKTLGEFNIGKGAYLEHF